MVKTSGNSWVFVRRRRRTSHQRHNRQPIRPSHSGPTRWSRFMYVSLPFLARARQPDGSNKFLHIPQDSIFSERKLLLSGARDSTFCTLVASRCPSPPSCMLLRSRRSWISADNYCSRRQELPSSASSLRHTVRATFAGFFVPKSSRFEG